MPCRAQSLLGRFLRELAPAIQLAHDLRDVHGRGGFFGFGLFFLLPQDDGAGAGAEVTASEWEIGAGQRVRERSRVLLKSRRAPKTCPW